MLYGSWSGGDDSSWTFTATSYASWRCEATRSAARAREVPAPRWKLVHTELHYLAKRRASLDAEEARWIREAEQLKIWKEFGLVSMLDYLERVLGYSPTTGQQRLRVARALGDLPALTEALASGELCFSAIKPLVPVVTPATEGAWLDAVRGKSVRQVEKMCEGHQPGDRPEDPPDPAARLHRVVHDEVTGSAYAVYRQAITKMTADHGSRMSDSAVLSTLANAYLAMSTSTSEHSGRAKYQIAYKVCPMCDRAKQNGGGVDVPVTRTELEQARCFAQHIGDIDSEAPERAKQDIPPATVRFVWARDEGLCQTPGCRSTVGLEIHHIIPRSEGGTHDPKLLTLRCGACHTSRHEGKLRITGVAPDNIVTEWVVPHDRPLVTDDHRATSPVALDLAAREASSLSPPTRYAATVLRTEALSAMRNLGWSVAIARSAVDEAVANVGAAATLEEVLREAIRRAPRPNSA